MDYTVALLSIAGAMVIGAMSPGPSFLMVARTAVASSRAHGVAAALGMGAGGVLFALAALLGLQAVLAAVPALYVFLKAVGGVYLIYLGYRIWRGAVRPLALTEGSGPLPARQLARSFLLGFGTQVSNPKTAIVYASIFAALLPRVVPAWFFVAVPLLVFAIETGWYSIVAFALSTAAPRAAYLRCKVWIDRTAGGVMALLGVKLVASAADV
jgi:threonine/homoserine/homoserine lactone efflux protein